MQSEKEVMDWFFKLAVFGTPIAFVSILLPWAGVDMGRLSSGGDFALTSLIGIWIWLLKPVLQPQTVPVRSNPIP